MFGKEKPANRFEVETPKTDGATTVQIITDRETGVQYLLGMYATLGSGMTVLVDAEGKPLLKQRNGKITD
ncbi:DUF6440 family protein [Levilactobacillus yiduensis]|uniref:DUF6440 family protein n=1 Tax=Levilactobacillus yiduensis TaxID=2953880 RepID=UPI000EF2CC73|nr:DUF6440 family protein [Levilactobacillus yiduensis]AYM01634.1 hypothetical protein D8911_00995 [Levilactobacillus brevis]